MRIYVSHVYDTVTQLVHTVHAPVPRVQRIRYHRITDHSITPDTSIAYCVLRVAYCVSLLRIAYCEYCMHSIVFIQCRSTMNNVPRTTMINKY